MNKYIKPLLSSVAHYIEINRGAPSIISTEWINKRCANGRHRRTSSSIHPQQDAFIIKIILVIIACADAVDISRRLEPVDKILVSGSSNRRRNSRTYAPS